MSQDMKAKFGKVAVLYGGWAAERPVSLKSGAAVLKALQASGVDAHGIDVGRNIISVLQAGKFDRVFNILHGAGGEDGVLQGALEILGLPYTGCGVMASAISMDKLMTKRLWAGAGLPTPAYRVLTADADFDGVVAELGLPLMVKPATEGSSIGMSKVKVAGELEGAYRKAAECSSAVLVEQWVTGAEYTAGIVAGESLPLIRLEVPGEFYDYEAKYLSDDTRYFCPCGLDAAEEQAMQQLARQAFDVVGGRGWGRVDMMRDAAGNAWLIEVNTNPGMTDHSLVPMGARVAGMDFNALVMRILETTL
ncbi:D-alanine--D-alanine ligase [Candidatus Thiothrix sp. Deng01]|uniref:D-alanine--D-alanine ligase n=1 Tax=Candidatus Thiothrix phosphatis TaxID=3112415 RepID=A0ABU6CZ34_9GAMM|nr:D-alanine--D-alanine ligase [Candidatus Thiothrix sp. Deng01]MEB4592095.1 D-alanine--D-alanine ligase [Candidatus Thiothrix sp. Deng01]